MTKKNMKKKTGPAGKKKVGPVAKKAPLFCEKVNGVIVHKSRIESASEALVTKGVMADVAKKYLGLVEEVSDNVSILIEVKLVPSSMKLADEAVALEEKASPVEGGEYEEVEDGSGVHDPFAGVDLG